MGQYYRVIILEDKEDENKEDTKTESDGDNNTQNENEVVLTWMHPYDYDTGVKLMEHSYINDCLMESVEHLICPHGKYVEDIQTT
jgi:hypothetical protein